MDNSTEYPVYSPAWINVDSWVYDFATEHEQTFNVIVYFYCVLAGGFWLYTIHNFYKSETAQPRLRPSPSTNAYVYCWSLFVDYVVLRFLRSCDFFLYELIDFFVESTDFLTDRQNRPRRTRVRQLDNETRGEIRRLDQENRELAEANREIGLQSKETIDQLIEERNQLLEQHRLSTENLTADHQLRVNELKQEHLLQAQRFGQSAAEAHQELLSRAKTIKEITEAAAKAKKESGVAIGKIENSIRQMGDQVDHYNSLLKKYETGDSINPRHRYVREIELEHRVAKLDCEKVQKECEEKAKTIEQLKDENARLLALPQRADVPFEDRPKTPERQLIQISSASTSSGFSPPSGISTPTRPGRNVRKPIDVSSDANIRKTNPSETPGFDSPITIQPPGGPPRNALARTPESFPPQSNVGGEPDGSTPDPDLPKIASATNDSESKSLEVIPRTSRWPTHIIESNYTWITELSETADVYRKTFEHGHVVMPTSGDDLKCGFYALLNSYAAQGGSGAPPLSLEMLEEIFAIQFPGVEPRDIHDIHISKLWYVFAGANKAYSQLGIYSADGSRVVIRENDVPGKYLATLWIHNDLANRNPHVTYSHWSGMRPMTVQESDQKLAEMMRTSLGSSTQSEQGTQPRPSMQPPQTSHPQQSVQSQPPPPSEQTGFPQQKAQSPSTEQSEPIVQRALTSPSAPLGAESEDEPMSDGQSQTIDQFKPEPVQLSKSNLVSDTSETDGTMVVDSVGTVPTTVDTMSWPEKSLITRDPLTPALKSDRPGHDPMVEDSPPPANGSEVDEAMVLDPTSPTDTIPNHPVSFPPARFLPPLPLPLSLKHQPTPSPQTSAIPRIDPSPFQTVVGNPGGIDSVWSGSRSRSQPVPTPKPAPAPGSVPLPQSASAPKPIPASKSVPAPRPVASYAPTKQKATSPTSSSSSSSGLSSLSSTLSATNPNLIYGVLSTSQATQDPTVPKGEYWAPGEKLTGTVELIKDGGDANDVTEHSGGEEDEVDYGSVASDAGENADPSVMRVDDGPASPDTIRRQKMIDPSPRSQAATPSPTESRRAGDPTSFNNPTYPISPSFPPPSQSPPDTSPTFTGPVTISSNPLEVASWTDKSGEETTEKPSSFTAQDGVVDDDDEEDWDDEEEEEEEMTDEQRAKRRFDRANVIRNDLKALDRFIKEREVAKSLKQSVQLVTASMAIAERRRKDLETELQDIINLQDSYRDQQLYNFEKQVEQQELDNAYRGIALTINKEAYKALEEEDERERIEQADQDGSDGDSDDGEDEENNDEESGENNDGENEESNTAEDKEKDEKEERDSEEEEWLAQVKEIQKKADEAAKENEEIGRKMSDTTIIETNKEHNNGGRTGKEENPPSAIPISGAKRRRRDSDDGPNPIEDISNDTSKSIKRPTLSRPISQDIGALTTYFPVTSTQEPNPTGTPHERAQYRWYKQVEAQIRQKYLTEEYIPRATGEWEAAGRPADLKALVTAAEEMRDKAREVELEILEKRTEMGDVVRFPDIRLDHLPEVSKPELKRKIRNRTLVILKRNGEKDSGDGQDGEGKEREGGD